MRKEKDRTRYSTSLREADIEKISRISKETGLKKARVVDKALKLAFSLYKSNKYSFLTLEVLGCCNRVAYGTSLDKEDILEIDKISSETGLNKNLIFEKGLILLNDIYVKDKVHFFDI